MPQDDRTAQYIRAGLAILLAGALPFLLFGNFTGVDAKISQTYADALAAVVAFYFGSSG
jgi:hypothetical protein